MMGIATCAGCGLKVDTKMVACRHCGAKPRSSTKVAAAAVVLIGGALVLSSLGSFFSPQPESARAAAAPALAQAAKPPVDPALEVRVKQAVLVATLVKTTLRDPDAVNWRHIRVNEDASVVCLEYRARSGFGGLKLERTAYAKGRLSSGPDAWNKNCAAKLLHDLDYVRHSL